MKRQQQSECGGCSGGSKERWFLHNVRQRGSYRRLCTACVLKNSPGCFCPFCFDVYEELPPPEQRVMCLHCPSISHSACVPFYHSRPYQCPPCSDPNFIFFDISLSNINISKGSAKALVAAARIASASMSEAAAVAWIEAERTLKRAAAANKIARDALDRLAYLVSEHKENKGKETNKDYKVMTLVCASFADPKKKPIGNQCGQVGMDKLSQVGGQPSNDSSHNDKHRPSHNFQREKEINQWVISGSTGVAT